MLFTKREAGRIFSKIEINPTTGCWNWTGKLDNGYGRISWKGKQTRIHRLFYVWKFGDIPVWRSKKDKEIDHLCNNRACCNPDHLQLVSNRINVYRGVGPTAVNHNKTLCVHGHDSLYWIGNRRRCRECRRIFDASEKRKQWKKNRSSSPSL